MYEFTTLKILHEDMKVKKEERAIFSFTYNAKVMLKILAVYF